MLEETIHIPQERHTQLTPVQQFLVCFSVEIVRSRKISSHFSLFDTGYLKNVFEVFLLLGRA